MIQQWTVRQIHDTVGAIVSQRAYGAAGESLFTKFLRFVFRWVGKLFDWLAGTVDARLVVIAAAVIVAVIVGARIYVDQRYASVRRRGLAMRATHGGRRDFWAVAREFAAAGRYVESCYALHAAVIEAVTSAGLGVRYHASKTNGDYARELRRLGIPVASEFRAFGRDFDRVVYGHATPDAEDCRRLLEAGERIARSLQHSRAA